MKYQIRFVAGENVGQVFPLGTDAVAIGRSHSSDIQLHTPDVSGRHVGLTVNDQGVQLDNFSSRTTTVDGERLTLGQRVCLFAGQSIGLGSIVQFTLEALPDEEPPATDKPADKPANAADNDETVLPASEPQAASEQPQAGQSAGDALPTPPPDEPLRPRTHARENPPDEPLRPRTHARESPPDEPLRPRSHARENPPALAPDGQSAGDALPTPPPDGSPAKDDETIAMQTRMASPEELEYLKSSHEKRKFRKGGAWVFGIAALLAIGLAVYYCFYYRAPEKYVSWPRGADGKQLEDFAEFPNCPYGKDLQLKYPAVPECSVDTSQAGRLLIRTALGKYQDVPLRLTLEYFQDKEAVTCEREKTLEKWMASKTASSQTWNFDLVQPLAFYREAQGVPYLCVPYSRTEENESYVGYAVQIRQADWVFVLTKEVLTRDRWRAANYIQQVAFFAFSQKLVTEHWEGTATFQKGDVQVTLGEARALLQRNSPTVWNKVEYLLRSVLCLSCRDNQPAELAAALEMLKDLRQKQTEYYNQRKIAHQLARSNRDQKEQERISNDLKAVFSSEEDRRFHRIRQDKWD